jgi:ADP-dependent NAD(P)H-hydrate dehydratase
MTEPFVAPLRSAEPPAIPPTVPRLPARAAEGHKGDYGHVVIVGGSRGMAGAVGLAAMAALRSGSGLVSVAVPEPSLAIVAGYEPSYMTWPLPADEAGRVAGGAFSALEPLLKRATAVAVGPGIGRSEALTGLVFELFESLELPLVVDADGLNALAERAWPVPRAARLLTPHPGEYRRLCPDAPRDRSELDAHALKWGEAKQVTLILKGHRSLIADAGKASWNSTGNPGMATGGTGDVLTGIVTALIGQGLAPGEAARLACHVHGRAGDLAARACR